MNRRGDFAARLRRGDPLTGLFQKTAHHQVTELLGQTGIDFVVLDAEHAPFDPSQIDGCALAAKAVDLPLLVRIGRNTSDAILTVLDTGASGIFVPHIRTAEGARAAVSAARCAGGGRDLSPSTRAGGVGRREKLPPPPAATLKTPPSCEEG